MEPLSGSPAGWYLTDQWQSLGGQVIEVWFNGALYRRGTVDAAMLDGSGLWMSSDGAFQRQFIDAASGFKVWTTLYPRSRWDGTTSSGMTARSSDVRVDHNNDDEAVFRTIQER